MMVLSVGLLLCLGSPLLGQEGGEAGAPTQQPDPFSLLWPMIICFGVIYFLMIRPQNKKQRQELQNMLDGLKKNDSIRTRGGVIAKIVSVDRDRGIVTVKIDEQNNTRMRIAIDAVASVIDEGEDARNDGGAGSDKGSRNAGNAKEKAEVGP